MKTIILSALIASAACFYPAIIGSFGNPLELERGDPVVSKDIPVGKFAEDVQAAFPIRDLVVFFVCKTVIVLSFDNECSARPNVMKTPNISVRLANFDRFASASDSIPTLNMTSGCCAAVAKLYVCRDMTGSTEPCPFCFRQAKVCSKLPFGIFAGKVQAVFRNFGGMARLNDGIHRRISSTSSLFEGKYDQNSPNGSYDDTDRSKKDIRYCQQILPIGGAGSFPLGVQVGIVTLLGAAILSFGAISLTCALGVFESWRPSPLAAYASFAVCFLIGLACLGLAGIGDARAIFGLCAL